MSNNIREPKWWVKGTPGFWAQQILGQLPYLLAFLVPLIAVLAALLWLLSPWARQWLWTALGPGWEALAMVCAGSALLYGGAWLMIGCYAVIADFTSRFRFGEVELLRWHKQANAWRARYDDWLGRKAAAEAAGAEFTDPQPPRPY
jgi:hypothetical protein